MTGLAGRNSDRTTRRKKLVLVTVALALVVVWVGSRTRSAAGRKIATVERHAVDRGAHYGRRTGRPETFRVDPDVAGESANIFADDAPSDPLRPLSDSIRMLAAEPGTVFTTERLSLRLVSAGIVSETPVTFSRAPDGKKFLRLLLHAGIADGAGPVTADIADLFLATTDGSVVRPLAVVTEIDGRAAEVDEGAEIRLDEDDPTADLDVVYLVDENAVTDRIGFAHLAPLPGGYASSGVRLFKGLEFENDLFACRIFDVRWCRAAVLLTLRITPKNPDAELRTQSFFLADADGGEYRDFDLLRPDSSPRFEKSGTEKADGKIVRCLRMTVTERLANAAGEWTGVLETAYADVVFDEDGWTGRMLDRVVKKVAGDCLVVFKFSVGRGGGPLHLVYDDGAVADDAPAVHGGR